MLVRCDVCGVEPAAVLCCADEAALCSGCDRRVHRANKLADKHRRITLLHPSSGGGGGDSSAAASPLCDVCKERRGLVFCVEDRAILCADCDEPIHSANHLTASHTRFLLVGAKLSAAAALADDHPFPDDGCDSGDGAAAGEPHAAIPAQQGSKSPAAPDCSNGGGSSSSISDYLTNICPGWRVDDLLFDDAAAFSAAAAEKAAGCEEVPCLDADLFDVVAGRPAGKRGVVGGGWYGGGALMGLETEVAADASIAVPTAAAAKQQQQGRVRERHWASCDSDSDVFAVPEISFSQPPPAKKARPPPATPFWCF